MNVLRPWLTRVAAILLASLPGVALANPAPHAPSGITWFNFPSDEDPRVGFAFILLNFVVLMLVLNKLLFKGLVKGNRASSDMIRYQLARATEARTEAETVLAEYQAKVEGIEALVESIRSDAEAAGKRESEILIAEAKLQAEKIIQSAGAQAGRDAEQRRQALEAEIVEQALSRATIAIRAKFGEADESRLLNNYCAEVSATHIGDVSDTAAGEA